MEWGFSPLLGESLPSLAEKVVGAVMCCPDALPTLLLVMRGVRGTSALLPVYTHSLGTSTLGPPHTVPGNAAVHTAPPQLSPWQPRMTRGFGQVPGPQATSAWEEPGGEGRPGPGNWPQDGFCHLWRPPAAGAAREGLGPLHLMAPHPPQGRAHPSPDWKMRLTSWPRN